MIRNPAEQGPSTRTIAEPRVRAILKRGAIWDVSEFLLLRSVLEDVRSDSEAIRIDAMLHAFEYGESEDAA